MAREKVYPKAFQHFELAHSVVVGSSAVVEYQSTLSGVRVILADVERPLVSGYFTIRTEPQSDDGCPHSLEHLIFLGSEKYPAYSVLDTLASRCLAEATNAWTDIDHTAYTLTTAGHKGFLSLLPVYLDHVLHPLLHDDFFWTEVHHVNPKGKNDGVVYSEMSASEHHSGHILERAMKEALYPAPSGYRLESGGRLKELRELNNDTVRRFHEAFYRWDNMAVIVIGPVEVEQLLGVIGSYESADLQAHPVRNGPVAWTAPQVPLTTTKQVSVKFPCEDANDELGEISCAWRGPQWADFRDRQSLDVLGDYLTYSNAGPLQKALVENDKPSASNVDYDEEPFKHTFYALRFADVPRRKAASVVPTVDSVLKTVYMEPLDMKRLRATIMRQLTTFYQRLEDNPEEAFSHWLIQYFVNTPKADPQVLENMWSVDKVMMDDLMEQPQQFWKSQLDRFFISAPRVEVVCMPSYKLSSQVKEDRENLESAQLKHIEDNNLAEDIADKLKKAKGYQTNIFPERLLTCVPVAKIEGNVKRFQYPVYSNFAIEQGSLESGADAAPLKVPDNQEYSQRTVDIVESFPIPLLFCDIPSEFIECRVVFRVPPVSKTESAGLHALSYTEADMLPLLTQVLFETAVGTKYLSPELLASVDAQGMENIHHEAFTQIMLENLTDHFCSLGADGLSSRDTGFPELFTVGLSCKKDKVPQLVDILLTGLRSIRLTKDRLLSMTMAALRSLARKKRNSAAIASLLQLTNLFERDSIRLQCSVMCQLNVLRKVASDPEQYVPVIQSLADKIFLHSACCATIAASSEINHSATSVLDKLKVFAENSGVERRRSALGSPVSSRTLFPLLADYLELPTSSSGLREHNTKIPFGNAVLCKSITDSPGYCIISVPGALGLLHPDSSRLAVLSELMSACEGPLYSAVRGNGFAYSASMSASLESGRLNLLIFSSVDPISGLKVARQVMQRFGSDDVSQTELDKLVQNAKCTALFHLIRSEATMSDFALQQFSACLWRLPQTFVNKRLREVEEVTSASLHSTAKQYLRGFLDFTTISQEGFNEGQSAVIVASENKITEIAQLLRDEFNLKLRYVDGEPTLNEETIPDTTKALPEPVDTVPQTTAPIETASATTQQQQEQPGPTIISWQNLEAWAVSGDPLNFDALHPPPVDQFSSGDEGMSSDSDSDAGS